MVLQPVPEPVRSGLELLDRDITDAFSYLLGQRLMLSTLERQKYQLAFRFYGPSRDVVDGNYLPVLKALSRRRNRPPSLPTHRQKASTIKGVFFNDKAERISR